MWDFNFLLSMGSKRALSYSRARAQVDALVEHLVKYLFIGDFNNEHGWLRTIVNCHKNIVRLLKGDSGLLKEVVGYGEKRCIDIDIKQFIHSEYNPVFFEKQHLSNDTLKEAFSAVMKSSFSNIAELVSLLGEFMPSLDK